MPETVKELFGEPIFVYSARQAVEDGVLMENPSEEFEECDLLTTNLWNYIEIGCKTLLLTEPQELLDCIMKQARRIYVRGKFPGDNDRNFFVLKSKGKFKPIWFVRNENRKLTAMLPSDY